MVTARKVKLVLAVAMVGWCAHFVSSGIDLGEAPSVAADPTEPITVWLSRDGLGDFMYTFCPAEASPRNAEGSTTKLTLTGLHFIGGSAETGRGRFIATLQPLAATDEKLPPPVFRKDDSEATLQAIAKRSLDGWTKSWSVACMVDAEWQASRLIFTFTSSKGAIAEKGSAGEVLPPILKEIADGGVAGRQLLQFDTSRVPLQFGDSGTFQADLVGWFSTDFAGVWVQDASTAKGLDRKARMRSAPKLAYAMSLEMPQDWVSFLAAKTYPKGISFPGASLGFDGFINARLTALEASAHLDAEIVGTPGTSKFTVRATFSDTDLRLKSVKLVGADCGDLSSAACTVEKLKWGAAASFASQTYEGRLLRPTDPVERSLTLASPQVLIFSVSKASAVKGAIKGGGHVWVKK